MDNDFVYGTLYGILLTIFIGFTIYKIVQNLAILEISITLKRPSIPIVTITPIIQSEISNEKHDNEIPNIKLGKNQIENEIVPDDIIDSTLKELEDITSKNNTT